MSNELIFIIFIFIPFTIVGIFLTAAQRNFFNHYNKIFNPKEPVSVMDYAKKHNYNYFKIFQFLLTKSVNKRGQLYFKEYEDPKLNQYATLVKISFFCLFLIMFLGIFIFSLLHLA